MAWDFEVDPTYAEQLRWVEEFVRDEVEPLDVALGNPYDKSDEVANSIVAPLRDAVRERGLWAVHLGPELGGPGYGQVELGLLNEILGRSRWAPSVFGCQAPDSGNAEILARFGTAEQKQRYLEPLLAGRICSCYSMTEPQAGADPTLLRATAHLDGDHWVLNGEKWFSTNARYAAFFLVMAVTEPDAAPHRSMSMFIVPADTPGVEILRNVGLGHEPPGHGSHGYVRYDDVRVPADHLLGERGQAFVIAQTRLGGGRVHHAMRTIGRARKTFDAMCERALSREVRTGPLASLGVVQEQIAESWIQIEQFRLLVMRTAWLIDKHNDYRKVRRDIAAVKVAMPAVLGDVARRTLHLHGALGVSNEMNFVEMMVDAEMLALADGPSEVHRVTIARDVLAEYRPVDTLFPSGHLPTRREAALRKLAPALPNGWNAS
ncbi:MAG: acyl-CoA dehydrogenase family protein [Pseudonocardia sp.]|uniref:acyl-CoA dehydrogenase family protein n=1 Tax=unclassified Pseudonocardia TaxID=2619320 RepID=UPI00086914D0|nr:MULTISPECIES: acyl-CoA dehydrogenase family protein [unclassified Pseudonocardia]MBN9112186.1 acyl-CoA dehydrogenase family protein [Pseudonocardia sp.]ODU30127.1 MAG: acyl-CoA dehydrogenase [Pseudonocardia sp. SCN 72-51]ODV03051.1 MAG: acyl-CoA dehydrogenase [Pseudonocardia sp. SCN 73-27]